MFNCHVVNCFQNCTFIQGFTVKKKSFRCDPELWIAFRIVLLYKDSQSQFLFNSYSYVVNCFQNCTFIQGFTVLINFIKTVLLLWIAFRIVLLYKDSQFTSFHVLNSWCCELLSELYFYTRIHSHVSKFWGQPMVVNCFQNCTFIQGFTVDFDEALLTYVLWIAFRIVLLYKDSQSFGRYNADIISCELLSELYFYTRIHSQQVQQ